MLNGAAGMAAERFEIFNLHPGSNAVFADFK